MVATKPPRGNRDAAITNTNPRGGGAERIREPQGLSATASEDRPHQSGLRHLNSVQGNPQALGLGLNHFRGDTHLSKATEQLLDDRKCVLG